MRVAKTVRPLGLVRNFDRYKRPILASLMSAVLVISIVFVGRFFLTRTVTAQSGSSDDLGYFEVYVDKVKQYNLVNGTWIYIYMVRGPVWYNVTGQPPLQVLNVTVGLVYMENMTLVKRLPDGKSLIIRAPRANATKLVAYVTVLGWAPWPGPPTTKLYGNSSLPIEMAPDVWILGYVTMHVVYMKQESFSASQLNLTVTAAAPPLYDPP